MKVKLSKKKTCNGCRALNEYKGHRVDCELGVQIRPLKVVHGYTVSYQPMGECLKPITIKDAIKLGV